MNLQELANKHETDKEKLHGYMQCYEDMLNPIRESAESILEIGIATGASLRMWKEYFPNATIHGIDIINGCSILKEDRVKIHIGNQTDDVFLARFMHDKWFDLIVDDGSHLVSDIRGTADILAERLNTGCYYIIEDMNEGQMEQIRYYLENCKLLIWAGCFRGKDNQYLVIGRKI